MGAPAATNVPMAPAALRLAPRLSTAVGHIGASREPVLRIDDVLADPQAMIDFAAAVAFAAAGHADGGYPGVSAAAPLSYVEAIVRALDPVLREMFGLGNARIVHGDCRLSITTTPPDRLTPWQRVPHIDTTDPMQIALLHYFCDEDQGGTSFYRHRATGLEIVGPADAARYDAARDAEIAQAMPHGYICGSNARYERIAGVAARPNRLIAYRSSLLHSGDIGAGTVLDADPRLGRLTANLFVTYRHPETMENPA
jgi:hypothetical protein